MHPPSMCAFRMTVLLPSSVKITYFPSTISASGSMIKMELRLNIGSMDGVDGSANDCLLIAQSETVH